MEKLPHTHTLRISMAFKSQAWYIRLIITIINTINSSSVCTDALQVCIISFFQIWSRCYCSQLTYEETKAQKVSDISVTEPENFRIGVLRNSLEVSNKKEMYDSGLFQSWMKEKS